MKEIQTVIRIFSQTMLGVLLFSGVALADQWKPFDQEAFAAAKNEGKTVILDVYADWCGTCKKQKPILEGLINQKEYKDFVAFKIDFDKSAELKKALKVTKQSTLIVFKGEKEVARSVGVTDKDDIAALFKKGS
jgi:thioredoxin 1